MARVLTEHLESGYFSEARVLTHNFSPNDDTGILANIKDSATYGPSGDGSRRWLQMGNTVGENWVDLQMFGDYSEVYGEVWFYDPVQPLVNTDQIIRFYKDTTNMASVLLTPANKWSAFISTAKTEGSLYATWGVWHCLEFYYRIHASAGQFTGKIDGFEAFTFTGNTVVSAKTAFNKVRLFCQYTAVMGIDGLVINDTTGAYDNTWPGIILVASRDPITDMSTHDEWVPTSGSSKFEMVDEYPDVDSSYIYSTTDGEKQGFTYPDFDVPPDSEPIAVITEDRARKISSGQIYQYQKLGVTETASAAKDLGVDLKVVQNRQVLDPNGAAWTLANANLSETIIESNI